MKKWTGLFLLTFSFSISAVAESWDGYIVDQTCSGKKAMWSDSECVARCVRRGSDVVLVTADGTVYKIANQDKVKSESYGKKVTVTGKMEGDTITVDGLKM
jgi:Protein of unknown function (DUF5818)